MDKQMTEPKTYTLKEIAAMVREDRLQLLELAYYTFRVEPGKEGIHQDFFKGHAIALQHMENRWRDRSLPSS